MRPNLLIGIMIQPIVRREFRLRGDRHAGRALLAAALISCAFGSNAQAQSSPAIPMALVSSESDGHTPGSISGTVVDKDGASIPNAKIKLTAQKPNGNGSDSRETVTGQDGHFSFPSVASGPFEITVSASGFATQIQKGVVPEGAEYVVPNVQLVVATEVDVEVRVDPVEVAEEQIHVEETQRVFGVIPNFYVTYVPNAAPLDRHQKMELAWSRPTTPSTDTVRGLRGMLSALAPATRIWSRAHLLATQSCPSFSNRIHVTSTKVREPRSQGSFTRSPMR